MRVFNGLDSLPHLGRNMVTVGSYDGVHRGHRHLLDILKSRAAECGAQSTVVTFAAHPRMVLGKERNLRLLSVQEEKILLLSETGVDNLVIIPFNLELSRMTPLCFVQEILIRRIGACGMVVGYDHHFGRDRSGDFDFLEKMRGEYGFDVFEAPEFVTDGLTVSSTTVRRAVEEGDMSAAAHLLGHPYIMMVRGGGEDRRVRAVSELKMLPPAGVYDVEAGGRRHVLEISEDGMWLRDSGPVPRQESFVITF